MKALTFACGLMLALPLLPVLAVAWLGFWLCNDAGQEAANSATSSVHPQRLPIRLDRAVDPACQDHVSTMLSV